MRRFCTLRPGRVSYRQGLAIQEQLLLARREGREDILLLLEHPPVITLGRRGQDAHLLTVRAELERMGLEVIHTGRGGDVTYHGPGQVIGYPIVDLQPLNRDLHLYLRHLEEVLIGTLASFRIAGRRLEGKTGVWVGEKKIASIGVGVRQWVTWHGFALNVSDQTAGFAHIVPCGLTGVAMTSMEELLGHRITLTEVEEQLISSFASVFSSTHTGAYEATT
ncbi:MAG: lipoyl(octanoyl) transferase LipB [Desulfuromonadales bacterium]|nr:lipoyl(octanoyl) transferase LipB [Desulfuromonadales bacterium]